MMKRISMLVLAALIGAALTGCTLESMAANALKEEETQKQDENQNEEKAIATLVEEFGTKLKLVSLLAPQDVVAKSMEEHYGGYVTDELLAKWQSDPANAPGRQVSSPWPERIEIRSVEKVADNAYQVAGEIIEVTSAGLETEEAANKIPVTLIVKKFENGWLIADFALDSDDAEGEHDAPVYTNHEYGFKLTLPESWEGYTIVMDKWTGSAPGSSKVDETGPKIIIRHPEWNEKEPRQDIPILILTLDQRDAIQNEKFNIGAAPIGPSELGRNNKYVIALPARYNFEFLKGHEEVEQILQNNPLEPMEVQ